MSMVYSTPFITPQSSVSCSVWPAEYFLSFLLVFCDFTIAVSPTEKEQLLRELSYFFSIQILQCNLLNVIAFILNVFLFTLDIFILDVCIFCFIKISIMKPV